MLKQSLNVRDPSLGLQEIHSQADLYNSHHHAQQHAVLIQVMQATTINPSVVHNMMFQTCMSTNQVTVLKT